MNGIRIDSEPDREILKKLFQGKASKEEESLVIHWFSGLEHKAKLYTIFKKHWDEITVESLDHDCTTSPLLDRIHHNLNLGYNKEYRWISFYSKNVGIN